MHEFVLVFKGIEAILCSVSLLIFSQRSSYNFPALLDLDLGFLSQMTAQKGENVENKLPMCVQTKFCSVMSKKILTSHFHFLFQPFLYNK